MPSKQQIVEFWKWFQSVSRDFGEHLENEQLIDELDTRVGQLGPISWEVGPGVDNQEGCSFVLSPLGDPDLLPVTRGIIDAAPKCEGWEFYPAKPPKRWKRSFVIDDENGDEIEIDASKTRYVLLKYPDGVYDIILEDRGLAVLPKELKELAAQILLDGELGEQERMKRIHDVDVVSRLNENMRKKSNAIEFLTAQLAERSK